MNIYIGIYIYFFYKYNGLWYYKLLQNDEYFLIFTLHYATIRATVCSNRLWESIKCMVEFMRAPDWFSPAVSANSCVE